GTARSRRTRGVLVVAEVAIAVSVLIGAGLLLRSFNHLMDVDPGFRVDNALTFRVNLPPGRPREELAAFYNRLDQELNSLAGTTGAALISQLPMCGCDSITGVILENKPKPAPGVIQWAGVRAATPGYFATLDIRLKKGRLLEARDTNAEGQTMVAVVDQAMVDTYWPGEEVLGRRFRRLDAYSLVWVTVVGVVENLRHSDLSSEPRPILYMTPSQATAFYMGPEIFGVVRTQGDPKSFSTAVRNAVHAIDPNVPLSEVLPFEDVVNRAIAKNRLGLLLLGILACLALTLTIVGIYGVTAYSVDQRTNEIGLRLALGAQRGRVLLQVVRDTGLLAVLGVVLGVGLAIALTRLADAFILSLLYKVTANDPATYVGVALVLLLVAVGAAYLPGRRATRVNPIVTLRS
ncbi:MAG TPA: ABC transporter permease, partial [Acidobacteria bacterium]|nr:ABC transporter permease [Acidobacteriota bacterium]